MFQFSGQAADEMKKTYAEFCSSHLKAVKLYKELMAKDKRLQYFIRVREPSHFHSYYRAVVLKLWCSTRWYA